MLLLWDYLNGGFQNCKLINKKKKAMLAIHVSNEKDIIYKT